MILPSTLLTKLTSGVIDWLALYLCSTPINYDLPFFSAKSDCFFSYFEKEMEQEMASNFIGYMVSFPLLHLLSNLFHDA